MEGDVHGVRILPPVLTFDNTAPGTVYALNVVVKNVAGTSRSIRYYGPKSKLFKLKVKNPEDPVASGLGVPAVVEYEPKEEEEIRDRLVVTVDGEVIEVPIFGYPTRPALELQSEVDFGNVLANSKVIAREISLVNSGSKAGFFQINYEGDKPIAIIPHTGSIPPDSVQIIKVEFVTKVPGKFEEVCSVELEGREPQTLTIRGNVAKPALEVLSMKEQQPVSVIMFGNTYYGTDRTECAVLYNNGPEVINFVAIVDEEAIAQELGVDLTQTTTAHLAEEGDKGHRGETNEIISLVAAIPNQGVLMPYQKTPIFFRFSPRWNASKLGWKSQVTPPPRKDFALFVRLEIIGSNKGFMPVGGMKKRTTEGAFAEVALTGTALPVLLDISPSNCLDFGECPVGEHADVLCTIRNESAILPAIFQFRRIAHFSVRPPNGKIPPGQTQDIIFSFAPKQVGTFKPQELLDVLGQVSVGKGSPTATTLKIISTLPIQLMGCSNPISIKPRPRFNPGLTPYISNEVGMYVETTFEDLQDDDLRNAIAGSTQTRLHRLRPKSLNDLNTKVKVAFPNDRAQSVRPSERNQPYQTMFTKMDRHQYVDPDYAFHDDEMLTRKQHRNGYVEHLHSLRDLRNKKIQQKEYLLTNNEKDIGIKTAAGLLPRKLTQDEIKPDPAPPVPPNAEWKLLSAKDLAEAEKEALSKPVQDGLNAVPTTQKEKTDCSRWLSPQELHQVIVGPPTVEFGKVCLRSMSQKDLGIINNLQQYILVEAEIDCRELRQSSPLSQVVPPRSRAVIPIIFESSTKGNFQRSVSYTINKFYKNHVTVTAEVVPVGLELSTETLVLKPTPGLPAEAGFRGVITLHNRLNYQAEFTWSPDLGDKGTAFSIRPATGVVNANTSLDCEVVWHPSYLAPTDGSFTLLVHGGNPLKLCCQAELGPTSVYFMDSRIMFGAVPVNLTTTKVAMLHNSGHNHAYYQVLDPNPFPGLTVTPVHGVVPVGGNAEIRVSLTPEAILKFDTRVQVAIKGGRTIELRMGGTVEAPEITIDVPSFNFGGVYCGSKSALPFRMINKGNTRCKLEFDLSRFKDFNLSFPGFQTPEDYNYQLLNPGMSSVTLAPTETIEGLLNFEPLEVAAYDFVMPVFINHLGAPSPAPTPFPPTPALSSRNSIQHIINPRPQPVSVATPRKHIIATALRQPLQLSHPRIEFILPVNFYEMSKSIGVGITKYNQKSTVLVNNSPKKLKWGFDLRKVSKPMTEGIIKFLHSSGVPFISDGSDNGIEGELEPGETMSISVVFCPAEPGVYECVVPVVINEDWDTPYQFLHITGHLQEPRVWFDPPGICLTPVPLVTEVSCEFNVLASQYRVSSSLIVETPTVECEDGSKITPLKVTFLHGNTISQCSGDTGEIDPCCLPCKVTFSSPRPVSFTRPIIFRDDDGRSFSMVVTATADNCLLTCYPFLALHRVDHQIVREQDSIKGKKISKNKEGFAPPASCSEAIIVPVNSPTHASRPSTSATSSNFQISSSSYEHSASVTDSTSSTPGPRDGAMNKPPPTRSDFNSRNAQRAPEAASRLGSAMFPDEDSEEGIFHVEVLLAAQRWFSALGWPGGPFPINIPETLRNGISRKGPNDLENASGRGGGAAKKVSKTIYDMIGHLSGRAVPGIPINSPLPPDQLERVKQIYWQHSTLLTFLKCQGACIASIRPEYLMTARDFVIWRQLQRQVREELWQQGKEDEANSIHVDDDMEEEVFEAVSKRAWTDILLQILKTLILSKVTPRTYKSLLPVDKNDVLPAMNPDPLASNIYSVGERILLTWLNHYYETHRHTVWHDCQRGGVPPSRWVVNYDFDLLDGLVLGAVLGAHMPFLIKTHLQDMYTHPTTAEQCLHNALKVVTALRYAGIDYDIQAIDITDPNPIMMLLLVGQLYHLLPQYLPKATMEFTGTLHSTVTRQVKVTNPSNKPLTYQVLLAGRDARDFSVQRGASVTVNPRQTIPLSVEFTSRYLRPAEAMLILIGLRQGTSTGNTITFKLHTQVDNITPDKGSGDQVTVRVESPCFELERVILDVQNPFEEAGRFRVVLVESSGDLLDPTKPTALIKPKEKKPRKVRSKINHEKSASELNPSSQRPKAMQELFKKIEDDIPKLSAFFSPMESVFLVANGSAEVEVDFLPFSVGERQCSVIFLNETIGEFLYSIEAKASLPLPSALPFVPTAHSVRISSAAAAGSSGGLFGGEENVVYWKCEVRQMLQEKLMIPITNMARERALVIAAQQHMSDLELERRHLTGTLMSCSVTAKTIKMLATDPESVIKQAKAKVPGKGTKYIVEYDSENFNLPEMIVMPSPHEGRQQQMPTNTKVPKGVTVNDGIVELPVHFFAKTPGHYPCQIILRSMDDIRVYRIECTVNPEGSTAELTFTGPVHQSITQEIPILNLTNHDWALTAKIEGEGFTGPTCLLAKAYQKTNYPLVFKPIMERTITGKLVLHNAEDSQDHVFHLTGKAERPLALQNVKLKMEAKKAITHTIRVPNSTRKKLFYKVESDIPFLTGPEMVCVLPHQSINYTFTVLPLHRGFFTGVVAFVATPNPLIEVDSDGDEIPQDLETREYDGYRIWFSVEVTVTPPPPERVIPVVCACQKKILIEVVVRNPTVQDITLTATVTGRDLSGPPSISLAAGEKDAYTVVYAPAIIGKSKGSICFFNELVGEFWYELELEAQSPPPTTLPHMECELGKWMEQLILLKNPTKETLELIPAVSNTNNFSLQRENERPIFLQPHTELEVPVRFMPSALGQADHLGKIIFHSQQLGEWVFVASGTGLLPQPQDPVSVYTASGTNTTLIIPFRNPMDIPIVVAVTLKDHSPSEMELKTLEPPQSPFSLLLKNKTMARVGPKSTLDIPISFAPTEMRRYESLCTVVVTREDGETWPFLPTDSHGYPISRSGSQGLSEIRWLFPVYGIPESSPIKDSQSPVVECRARDSIEQRLVVSLAGVVSSASSQHKNENPTMQLRDKTPSAGSRSAPESVVVGETLATAEEFSYEFASSTAEMQNVLPGSVQVTLVRQERAASTGLVTLVFNVKFSPFRSMNCLAYLQVTSAFGGLWKFPVRFIASEPPVDDIISVEATGLGKMSSVGFRLYSKTKLPVIFNTYFESGSDAELTISPQTGELLPETMDGTLFTISFLPSVYGRLYRGKLIIQTPEMQWSYEVRGVLPDYQPPQGRSSRPMAGPHPDPRKRKKPRNYVSENLRLITTAVSSPVKGAPLFSKLVQ